MEVVPGSEFSLKVDLVLLAMGFVHVKHGKIIEELGVEYDPRGNIRCNPDYSTSAKGVFAAGDANTGASPHCPLDLSRQGSGKGHRPLPSGVALSRAARDRSLGATPRLRELGDPFVAHPETRRQLLELKRHAGEPLRGGWTSAPPPMRRPASAR